MKAIEKIVSSPLWEILVVFSQDLSKNDEILSDLVYKNLKLAYNDFSVG